MPRFAEINARINQAVTSHLSDVAADFGNGLVVDGLFNDDYANALSIVAGNKPTFECESTSIPNIVRGSMVIIKNVEYTVADLQPNMGMTLLVLEK
jgi:hypothetical protein